ncbi:MAG: Aclacinomycin methylesterase RdmC [Pseudomonas sp.]|nr:MAG: Aclacinomycin methylesterase RdmC [Pseudomonas sp.]
MPILNAHDLQLAYDSFGDEAGEVVLLIAGLGTQRLRWSQDFCQALAAQGYRVIRFDNRDTGQSTRFGHLGIPDFAALMAGKKPAAAYTLVDMAADAIGLLDALAIERAHVVGRSMGGMIAQLMAARYPQRVRSLTSIMASTGNPALPPTAPDVMAMMMRPAPDPQADRAGYLAHSVAFAQRIAGSAQPFDEAAHVAVIEQELQHAGEPGGFARQLLAIAMTGDLRPQLANVQAPTLVIHGNEDVLIHPACGQDTAESIAGAEWLPVDGMGHDLPPVLHGQVIAAIVRNARRAC